MRFLKALGRAGFGFFFIYNGFNHFLEAEKLKGYAAAKHVECPDLAVKGSGALLLVSGLSLMLGVKPQYGAAGTALFLAAVSAKMHDFWNQSDPSQKQNEMIQFSKNMALLAASVAIGAAELKKNDHSGDSARSEA